VTEMCFAIKDGVTHQFQIPI